MKHTGAKNRLENNKDAIIRTYCVDGVSAKHIANEYNCSITAVCNFLKGNGISKNYGQGKTFRHLRTESALKEIKRLYTEEFFTAPQIAEKYNTNNLTVLQLLKKMGVKVHGPGNRGRPDLLKIQKEIVSLYNDKKVSTVELAEIYTTNTLTIRNILKNNGVTVINRRKNTYPERKVEEILLENEVEYLKQFKISTRYYDFFLPKHHLLIEVNGTYWHADTRFYTKLDKIQLEVNKRDKEKRLLAKNFGYNIIYIWEFDIINNIEIPIKQIKDQIK